MDFLCHLSLVAIFAFVLAVSQGCNSLENTSFTSADKLIPPAPTSSAVRGEEHKIYCSKNDSYPTSGIISWYDILGSDSQIRLYDGFTKVTNDPKYFDFGIDYDYEYQAYSNLLIKDMAISKEGTYGCSLEDEMHLAKITMEVEASDLYIQTPDGNTPEVVEGIEDSIVQLTCKSVAARPALDLRWYQKKERDSMYTQITSGFQEVQSPNEQDSDTFDTTSDLRYNLHKTYHLGNLKCEASGQTAATLPTPDVLTLKVQ